MSKTTPVRWWRDDATRYQSRPPYIATRSEPVQFEPIPPLPPDIAAALDRANEAQQERMRAWLAPETLDVIADIKRGLHVAKRTVLDMERDRLLKRSG